MHPLVMYLSINTSNDLQKKKKKGLLPSGRQRSWVIRDQNYSPHDNWVGNTTYTRIYLIKDLRPRYNTLY